MQDPYLPDGPASIADKWICERCFAIFAEYVNGCPCCETGETGGSAKVVPVQLSD